MKRILLPIFLISIFLVACSGNTEEETTSKKEDTAESEKESKVSDLNSKVERLLHETRMTEIEVNGNLYNDDVRTKEEMKKTSTAIFDETEKAEKDYKKDDEYKKLKKLANEDDLTDKEIIDFTEKYLNKIRTFNIPN
ncbi:hypothetical protein [Mammaliicoccus fleurettii]|uniref:hypothetical protein n=1 Tax=Mammaliicoccus fleurettii TaxID=150056 RepID=UPI002DB829CE|nr:hypothetical protein [Mammaliicoccus fleurettii]MEB7723439.1 hypothetical protein [Mammaliicoccus fleurettii]